MSAAADNMDLVDMMIGKLRPPSRWRDDLRSCGYLALVKAERTHNPALQPFRKYAAQRVFAAIIDELRRLTGGRTTRDGVRVNRNISWVDIESAGCADSTPQQDELLDRVRGARRVRIALEDLSPRDRNVAIDVADDAAMVEIGTSLRLSRSRVCRINQAARSRLAGLLGASV